MKLYNELDTEIASKVNDLWKGSRDKNKPWREEAEEDFNFVAGHQWDESDINKLKDQNRPVVTFNRCNPILSAILGMEANQRQQTSFNPRGNTDSALSEAIDYVATWARDYAEAEIEEAQSFEDMLTCGMGWTDTTMNFEVDLDGKIIQETINPLQMAWDTTARKRNLTDSAWVCRGLRMAPDEIKETWPKAELTVTEEILRDDGEDDEPTTTNVDPQNRYKNPLAGDEGKQKKPTVLKFQWYEKAAVWRTALPNAAEIFEMDDEKYKKLGPMLEKMGAKIVKQYKRKYYQAYVYGDTLLEKKESASQTGFTLKCITGKRDKINNTWYGIVRLMKDPQRWANKFFSSFIDIIDSNSKGGLIAEEGAVSDVKKFEDDWAKADSVIWVRTGTLANNRIQPKPAAPFPQSVDRLLQFAIQSIYDCTGMNMEMLGMADRAQANVLEETRKKSAYTILAPFFDSLRAYRKESGVTLMEFIKLLPVERIEEVLEPEMKQYASAIKNIELTQMNVIVTESPQSDNHKMIVWSFISQVVPQLMKMGVPVPPEIFEYSPLPSPLVTKWKQMMDQKSQLPPQVQQQMQQMQQMIQELQKENQQLQMGEQSKLAELSLKRDISGQEMELKRQEIQEEFAMKREEMGMKLQEFMLELKSSMMSEVQKATMEINADKEKHMLKLQAEMIMHKETMKNQPKEAKNADR